MYSEELQHPLEMLEKEMYQGEDETEKQKFFTAELKKIRKARLIKKALIENGVDPEMLRHMKIKERSFDG